MQNAPRTREPLAAPFDATDAADARQRPALPPSTGEFPQLVADLSRRALLAGFARMVPAAAVVAVPVAAAGAEIPHHGNDELVAQLFRLAEGVHAEAEAAHLGLPHITRQAIRVSYEFSGVLPSFSEAERFSAFVGILTHVLVVMAMLPARSAAAIAMKETAAGWKYGNDWWTMHPGGAAELAASAALDREGEEG